VYKLRVVEYLIAVAKLFEKEPDLILVEVVLAVEQKFIQIASVAELHNQVQIVLAGNLDFLVVD
jgi:hypothetical protein